MKFKTRGRIYNLASGGSGVTYTFSGTDGITTNLNAENHLTIGYNGSSEDYVLTPQKFIAIGDSSLSSAFPIVNNQLTFVGAFEKLDKSAIGLKADLPNSTETPVYFKEGKVYSQFVQGSGEGYTLTPQKMLAESSSDFVIDNSKFSLKDEFLTSQIFSTAPSSGTETPLYQRANKAYIKYSASGNLPTAQDWLDLGDASIQAVFHLENGQLHWMGDGNPISFDDIFNKFKSGELKKEGILEKKWVVNKDGLLTNSIFGSEPTLGETYNVYNDNSGKAKVKIASSAQSLSGKRIYGDRINSGATLTASWNSSNNLRVEIAERILTSIQGCINQDSSIPQSASQNWNGLANFAAEDSHTVMLEFTLQEIPNNLTLDIMRSVLEINSPIRVTNAQTIFEGMFFFNNGGIVFDSDSSPNNVQTQIMKIEVGVLGEYSTNKTFLILNRSGTINSNILRKLRFSWRFATIKH